MSESDENHNTQDVRMTSGPNLDYKPKATKFLSKREN